MIIKTKFNIGDQFYSIRSSTFKSQKFCDVCAGEGEIKIPKYESLVMCPACYGRGKIESYGKEEWGVEGKDIVEDNLGLYSAPIASVSAERSEWQNKTTYTRKGFANFYYEKDMFTTMEEAQDECDRRNGIKSE